MRVASAAAPVCWGIFREAEHSPGRVDDDAAILRAAGRRLEETADVTVHYRGPEALDEPGTALPPLVFAMCEGEAALRALSGWERRGVCVVNSASSILNTHRERTVALLDGRGVPTPEGRLIDTAKALPRGSRDDGLLAACWVKQATGHKTADGSVEFASGAASVSDALDRLRGRGVSRALLQRHVEGDWVKFYGVGGRDDAAPAWFRWFHPPERPAAGSPFDARRLRDVASRGAALLGLDVWGGDAIVTAAGEIFVIDLNAFPSFALYREEAAASIAAHLGARLRRRAPVAV
ncbi:MAG TPA: hypothetical protein VMN82_13055 [Thermoanaerobaculia bacterium]|nr:hypothetical protein [Thermoanaerobaculia bacterium]